MHRKTLTVCGGAEFTLLTEERMPPTESEQLEALADASSPSDDHRGVTEVVQALHDPQILLDHILGFGATVGANIAASELVAWVRGIRVRRPDISQADAVEVALGCLANEAWDVTGDLHLQRSKLASERWTLEFRDDSDARYKVRVDLKGVAAVVEAMPEEAP